MIPFMVNAVIDAKPTGQELQMLRFIAGSTRPLTKDPKTTPLGQFDTLQKIWKKYSNKWVSLWICCMDGFCDITPKTPLQQAIELIEAHGGAAGIVGVAIVSRQFVFLKKPLKAGKGVDKILDWSGNVAADRVLAILEPMADEKRRLKEGKTK
jgi:hypothetical protein